MERRDGLKGVHYTIAGGVSGGVSRAFGQPLDVLKIRQQITSAKIRNTKYNGIVRTAQRIVKNEGLFAFWKGHIPAQALSVAYGAIMFSSYQFLQGQTVIENNVLVDFVCGGSSGMIASMFCQPFDVLRTRLVAQEKYTMIGRQLLNTGNGLYHEAGLSGFFKGLSPTMTAIFPYMGINFAFYKSLKTAFKVAFPEKKETTMTRLTCSAMSGLGSKLMLLPIDVVKKHLQVQGLTGYTNEYSGMMDCFKTIFKKGGVSALYVGAAPSLIKSIVVVSVSFTTFEKMCDLLCNVENES